MTLNQTRFYLELLHQRGSPCFNLKTVKIWVKQRKAVECNSVSVLKFNFLLSLNLFTVKSSVSSDRECLSCPEYYNNASNIMSAAYWEA